MSNFQTVSTPSFLWQREKKNPLKVTQKSKQKPARNKSPVSRTSTCQVAQTHNIQGHYGKNQTYAGSHIAPSVPGSSTARHSRLSGVVLHFITVGTTTYMNAVANLMTHIIAVCSLQMRTCSNVILKHRQRTCVQFTRTVRQCKIDITTVCVQALHRSSQQGSCFKHSFVFMRIEYETKCTTKV